MATEVYIVEVTKRVRVRANNHGQAQAAGLAAVRDNERKESGTHTDGGFSTDAPQEWRVTVTKQ